MGRIIDDLDVRGDLVCEIKDKHGNIKDRFEKKNLIVTAGKNFLAALLAGNTTTIMSHVAIGTSNQAAAAGDSALIGTELARVSATVTQGTGGSSNKVTYSASFGAGVGTGSIYEAGIFNASSAGTMLSRIVFATVKSKGSTDTFTITWTISYPL